MDPGASNLQPRTLFAFRTPADIAQHVIGSDTDIGGYSTAKLDLDANSRGRFSGVIRTDVKPSMQTKMRSGYAGFRNKVTFSTSKFWIDLLIWNPIDATESVWEYHGRPVIIQVPCITGSSWW